MAKRQSKTPLTRKKKKWYEVVAPPELRSVVVGETPASDPKQLPGRIIKLNLMTVTRDIKKQNITVSLIVKGTEDGKILTEFVGYERTSSYIKRLVKRSKTKVDDSFRCMTEDGIKVIVKPIILIKNDVQKSVVRALRKSAKELIIKTAAEKKYSEFVSMILSSELQKMMKQNSRQIYPVNIADIRAMKKSK